MEFKGPIVVFNDAETIGNEVDSRVGIIDIAVIPLASDAVILDIEDIDFQSVQDFFQPVHGRESSMKSVECPSKR